MYSQNFSQGERFDPSQELIFSKASFQIFRQISSTCSYIHVGNQ
jgi:hypothetical protein